MVWPGTPQIGSALIAFGLAYAVFMAVTWEPIRKRAHLNRWPIHAIGEWFADVRDFELFYLNTELLSPAALEMECIFRSNRGAQAVDDIRLMLGRHSVSVSPESPLTVPVVISEGRKHRVRFDIPQRIKKKRYNARIQVRSGKARWVSGAFRLDLSADIERVFGA